MLRTGLVVGLWLWRNRCWRREWAIVATSLFIFGVAALSLLHGKQTNEGFFSTRRWHGWDLHREAALQVF